MLADNRKSISIVPTCSGDVFASDGCQALPAPFPSSLPSSLKPPGDSTNVLNVYNLHHPGSCFIIGQETYKLENEQQYSHHQLRKGKYMSLVWKPNEMLWFAKAWRVQYQGGGGMLGSDHASENLNPITIEGNMRTLANNICRGNSPFLLTSGGANGNQETQLAVGRGGRHLITTGGGGGEGYLHGLNSTPYII
ncbi:hypothetical protein L1887_23866 [Cichorium endivia]|nr:hypothetical protein L1887_23866 [Cichorium endivia]